MSGLLGNLITQVAQNAIQGQMNQQQTNNQMGGLGNILGSVLGAQSQPQNRNDGFGLDDVVGMLGGAMSGSNAQNSNVLGQVLGSVLGGQSQSTGKNMMMAMLLPMALNFIQQNGGLTGALSKISSMGLGQKANSWMSADQSNEDLDPSDIQQLFGNDQIQQVAQQTGCNSNEVCQGMAQLLPQIFDSLTPDGDTKHENQANNEISQILSQLQGFMR